ncbi:hypothetical protein BDV59DRAFT_180853 [Aspergillus ambiguus]|uniref:uncharacterized protein n=1 Tax=Aspergillus ambiguus TaxID=176160 RepID=UPI003CCCCF99
MACELGECSQSFGIGMDRYISDRIYGDLTAFPNITGNDRTYFKEPPIFLFQSRWWDGPAVLGGTTTVAYCHLDQIYVEAAVTCIGDGTSIPQCSVTSMRDSLERHPPKDVTMFLSVKTMTSFAERLVSESSRGHEATSSLTERYMNNTANPLAANIYGSPLFRLPPKTFSERLSQVINTYYMGSLEPTGITGDLSAGGRVSANLWTEGTRTVWNPMRYRMNAGWMFMFLLSTLTMLVAAIGCCILIDRTNIPDILGAVSSMTRDTSREPFPPGGSTLDGIDRARLLKDMSVRLGEVQDSGSTAGYLAFTGSEMAARARRGGLYG